MLDILDSIAKHWQSIGSVILSATVSGAAGGIGAHFINNERAAAYFSSEKSDHAGRMLYQFGSKRQSGFIGACGAIGFIFFLTAIDGINGFVEMKEILRFISLSMIAGFGARRLLPMMVGNLEKQIAHAEQSADKALITANANEKRMTRAEQKLDLVRINADLLTAAQLNAAKSRREHAMREAEAAITKLMKAQITIRHCRQSSSTWRACIEPREIWTTRSRSWKGSCRRSIVGSFFAMPMSRSHTTIWPATTN